MSVIAVACLLLLGACSSACAPQVRDGWVRLPPSSMAMGGMRMDASAMAGMSMMAGFGRIENRCPMPLTIVSAHSAAFAEATLHETRIVDGISRMRPVPELRIAADDAAVLKPGGLHLMLMRPKGPLKVGSRVAIEFGLKGGGRLLGEFEVRGPDATSPR